MSCRFILLTNNPLFKDHNDLPVDYRASSSRDILIAARDLIHLGWELQTSPLYGNFRPHQQPFRSVLLKKKDGAPLDQSGLSLLEQAIQIYENNPFLLLPEKTPPQMFKDCSAIDFDLMRESLMRSGLTH